MPKEHYYKKYKRISTEKIQQLYTDIRVIIEQPDSLKAMEIKMLYKLQFDLEDAILAGSTTKINKP